MYHFYTSASSINGYVKVLVGNDVKLIKIDSTISLVPLGVYFKKYYCKAKQKRAFFLGSLVL
jgi:hypothetical protein